PPCSTLFPYTTLFRSGVRREVDGLVLDRGQERRRGSGWSEARGRVPEEELETPQCRALAGGVNAWRDRRECRWTPGEDVGFDGRSEEHTSELQSRRDL